ncbi:CYTH domain-containing protein [Falsiporphyromonas endometrii]|uniref:CYTH domain-containing protein n=1 Tax=Falsiporphyromonas endometrii TaxID=1387297 RepID=A0ABV9K5W9_9PORP
MEIERKFLIADLQLVPTPSDRSLIKQAYLRADSTCAVRIRIRGDKSYLTIKGASSESGMSREEFEYEIPLSDAERMIKMCPNECIIKERLLIPYKGHTWEVDVFHGRHEGLVLAEVELSDESESVDLPLWVGREVTGDPRYYNSYLINHTI